MTDIFADWKTNRFVVAPAEYYDNSRRVVVLTDIPFWTEHADQLTAWCRLYGCVQQGMTVEIASNSELTLFHLRWQ